MGELAGWDLGVPLDTRLLVALAAIFVASFTKGVAGLGVPLVATPVLASMYGLQTAIVIVTLPMVVSDVPFVLLGLRHRRQAYRLAPFLLAGLVGMVLGTQLLVSFDQTILAAVLSAIVILFVLTSWFSILPTLDGRTARIAGLPLGLVAGLLQGSSGASGPLVTMYLLSLGIPRQVFMFSINVIFQGLDAAQFLALQRLGLYTPGLTRLALLACVPLGLGLLLGFKTHKYVNDVLFRRIVLVILLLGAVTLLVRVSASF